MRTICKRFYLVQAFNNRLRAVRQHKARSMTCGIAQNIDEVLDDKRLASGERKLFNSQIDRFVDKRFCISKRYSIESAITGL